MNLLLFFDDQWIIRRDSLKREYGKPRLIPDSVYYDPNVNASIGSAKVIYDERINKYRLYYTGYIKNRDHGVFVSEGDDGIHWKPLNIAKQAGIENPMAPNQCVPEEWLNEAVAFYYVKGAEKPYKIMASKCLYGTEWCCDCRILESADGIKFENTGFVWHNTTMGCEPLGGCFFNEITNTFIICCRPIWGDRRVCYVETPDFKTFSEVTPILQADSIDEPLMDIQGMSGHWYENMAIGFVFCYHVPTEPLDKAIDGKVDAQLAYSFNGKTFMRSLRTPFMENGEAGDITSGMVWPSDMHIDANGDILITTPCSNLEHGYFEKEGSGCIATYKLRKDDFIHLATDGGHGRLCTRFLYSEDSKFSINIKCPHGIATCAIYDDNVLDKYRKPLEGFSHEDCIPFTGDSTEWIPEFKNHSIAELKEKVFMLEIKLNNGILYSIRGNFIKMMATELFYYKHTGKLPTRKGV